MRIRALLLSVLLVVVAGRTVHAEPVVPGYYRLRDEAKDVNPAELGQLLIGELNCTSCHAPPAGEGSARVSPKGAPDLSAIGARVTPNWIRAYLSDPHKVKPGATMPDIFHASEPDAKNGAVDFLAHFLAAQGGPLPTPNSEGNTVLIDRGRKLYHSIGCVACHAPEKGLKDPAVVLSVPHGELAGKYSVESLSAFLTDPHKARPAGRMPSLHLAPKEALALATYLLREQIDNPQVVNAPPLRVPGVQYEFYANTKFPNVEAKTFETVEPTSRGTIDSVTLSLPELEKPADNFGVRFTGLIAIPTDGTYEFILESDDGSRLYIDDKPVVENDGIHPPKRASGKIDLTAGDHALTLTFFEGNGGESLSFSWRAPGMEKSARVPNDVLFRVGERRMLPLDTDPDFKPDAQKVAMGGKMFAAMGCANCHAMPGLKPMRPAKALADLKDPTGGCLAEKPAKGLPHYDLSEEQRAFIGEALADGASLAQPLDGEALVTHTLASMNCLACHQRNKVGGATKDRAEFFTMVKPFDMGDEGRLPPRLTGVGNKLQPAAMEHILFEGKLHVRGHHMATRMPQFHKDDLPGFVDAVQKLDSDAKEYAAPAFSEMAARDGRTLVGIKGLGCINCHGVAGVPSMGMPALDLSLTAERLKPGWFHQLLLDPNSKNRGTRMPAFWFDGAVAYPELAGGTADKQIDAIWTYLSLGKSMGLPAGLQPSDAAFELIPAGEPIIHRTFLKDVGTRAILVGSPDGLHVAFDANAVRLAEAWRGKFFDAAGSRGDRGGKFTDPSGTDLMKMPPGPSFAVLMAPDAPWPVTAAGERGVGGTFKGYHTDNAGQPTFAYQLGDITISETPTPVLRQGGTVLVRKFELKGAASSDGLTFLAAAGETIEPGDAEGAWKVDGKLTLRIDPKLKPLVRENAGTKQLLIPATGLNSFNIEVSW